MSLGRLAGVMFGVLVMRMGEMRVMGPRFVLAVRKEAGGFAMMLGGLIVVLGGELVLLGGVLGVRHGRLPWSAHLADGVQ
ncbi:MAG: hypothetical protein ACLPNY_10235 [Roseiarcus sp.]